MKRLLKILLVTVILILGLVAIHHTKDQKLKTQNPKAFAEEILPATIAPVANVEPPVAAEPPKAVVETPPPAIAQPSKPIAVQGDCKLAYNYDWNADIAYQVCMKESGGRADATNWTDNHKTCTGSYGLWQIGCFWFPYYGYGPDAYYHPQINTEIAYNIWKRQGNFKAWSACRLVAGCY